MTDQEDNNNLGKIVFDDNNQGRKSSVCLGQTCSRSLIVSLSRFFVILLIIFGCFWRIHLSKTCEVSMFGLEFCAVRQDTFYPHQDYEQVNVYKISSLYFIGWSFQNWKFASSLQLAQIGTFKSKFDKIYFFINILNLFTMLFKKKSKISSLCVE